MRLYTVYQGPEARGDADLVFIRDGFCWPALILPFIWPLFRRMWLVAAVVLAVFVAVSALVGAGVATPVFATAVELAIALFVALEGNNLRRWTLSRRGWREIGVVAGRGLSDAERRFFSSVEVTPTGAILPRGSVS